MATAPIVGTLTFEVSVYVIDPTAANETLVTVTSPAAEVFNTASLVALPSATASANLITCEYEAPCPAAK